MFNVARISSVRWYLVLAIIPLLAGGCGIIRFEDSGQEEVAASGVFLTRDAGDSWISIGDIYGLRGEQRRVAYGTVSFVLQDEHSSATMYVGTDVGLFYTLDRGVGWQQTLGGRGVVNALSIDPTDACTLYAAVHNHIYKSSDCARSWQDVHFSSLAGEYFTSVMVSRLDPATVYVGSSREALLESNNGGRSWQVKQFVGSPVTRLIPHPTDVRSFYMVTQRFGIQKTSDSGISWSTLNELPVRGADGEPIRKQDGSSMMIRDLNGSSAFLDLAVDKSQENGLIYASGYGIFRLLNGEYWQEIEVLNKPNEQRILTVGVSSTDGQTIYFATNGALYRSVNGGVDWTIRELPTSSVPKFLAISPDSNVDVYVFFAAR